MDRRTFIGASSAAVVTPVQTLALTFTKNGVPDVKPGHLKCFIIMSRNKEGREHVYPAYYLNAYPLEYQDPCDERGCPKDEDHSDGCPTTGWFYDESNFEYDNCYFAVNGEVIAWASLPSADDVKAAFAAA